MTPDDIFGTLKSFFSERIASPFWFSFTVAWCVWNYRFLVILFSDNPVTTTFNLIDEIAFPDLYARITFGFALPLLSALLYVFLYPYPAKYISDFSLRRQREQNESKMKIVGETLLSKEKSDQIYILLRTKENEHRQRIDQYEAENQALLDELERLRTSSNIPHSSDIENEQKEEAKNMNPEKLTDDDLAVLYLVATADGSINKKEISNITLFDNVKIDWILNRLKRMELLSWIKGGPGGGQASLTEMGTDYVMTNEIVKKFKHHTY